MEEAFFGFDCSISRTLNFSSKIEDFRVIKLLLMFFCDSLRLNKCSNYCVKTEIFESYCKTVFILL